MVYFFGPDTSWLSVTNIVFGVVSIACVVAFVGVAAYEVITRVRERRVPAPRLRARHPVYPQEVTGTGENSHGRKLFFHRG